ncbi:MAG: Cyclohexadienyl dehydrogenase [Anaerolineae bacterium]|nr:Cyclohexadienyl dehydrogenase [Anaerolineae bacterium]RIK27666.1 MAG: hypothetical protein DCC52_09195 [Chloroflexota bacterium]
MKPRITIIGLGRLGASIGLALKKSGAELEIVGHDKARDAGNAAQKAGAIDKHEWNLYNACQDAGMIVLAMPVAGVLETIELLKDELAPGVIVTDTAPIKQPILQAARAFKPGVHFIGGHPIFRPTPDPLAPRAQASADLFRNAQYCLTPAPDTAADALDVLSGFVALLGANPLFFDAAEHDGLAVGAQDLALVMQAVLLKTTTASSGWRELNKFAGDDYFRATELAAQDAKSIVQLLRSQQAPLQGWLMQTQQTLRELQTLLAQNDAAALEKWLSAAQTARTQWLENKVAAPTHTTDYSEVRSSASRLFLGGLAPRLGGNKKK